MTLSFGEQLKSIREARGISLEEMAQKTHIRMAYLEALETGDYEWIPSEPQRRGFLKLYASELGVTLDGERVKGFQQEPEPKAPDSEESDSEISDAQSPITQEPAVKTSDSQQSETQPSDPQPEKPTTSTRKEEYFEKKTQFQSEKRSAEELRSENDSNEIEFDLPDLRSSKQRAAPTDSTQLFSNLGDILRQRRELLSLSLDDIHEHIHIRKKFLSAMEAGNFNQLPSPVQARGMLANYADFLNLDVDEILLKYADGLQIQRFERIQGAQPNRPEQKQVLSKTRLHLKNFFSIDLLVIAALFIGFAAFLIWGVNRILTENAPDTTSTDLPEVADVLLATESPTPQNGLSEDEPEANTDQTGTPSPEEPTPIFTPFPNDNPINIVIIPRQRTWVRVIADEEMVFEGRMLPGNAYDFSGEETLEVLTGSAGSLQVYFNEQDIGAPGLVGQVANLIFTENGLILPTPTNTPTITETPEATETPTPTLTPTQTLQPTFTESND
ncbi:MAG: helix-turn-helix domain-containing protein [Brevefilum sp.]